MDHVASVHIAGLVTAWAKVFGRERGVLCSHKISSAQAGRGAQQQTGLSVTVKIASVPRTDQSKSAAGTEINGQEGVSWEGFMSLAHGRLMLLKIKHGETYAAGLTDKSFA